MTARKTTAKKSVRRWGGGDVFSALADPTRRSIMDMLSESDQPVNALSKTFAISRPAISQHLRVLRNANLVSEQRIGRERHYRLQAGAMREVAAWITRYEKFWDERFLLLGSALNAMEAEDTEQSESAKTPSVHKTKKNRD